MKETIIIGMILLSCPITGIFILTDTTLENNIFTKLLGIFSVIFSATTFTLFVICV